MIEYTLTYILNGGKYPEGEENPASYNVDSDSRIYGFKSLMIL